MDLELVKAKILFKLARRRNWGGSHTAFDNLKKGFKPKEHEFVSDAADELIKENLLFKKPTGYGLHISLNPERAKEIKEKISKMLGVKVD